MPKIALQHSDKNPQSAENHSLIDELIAAVAAGGVKQRLRILQRITDLFVAGARSYSTEQIALFDDILQELAADIEVKARAKLAQRLADVSGAPPSSSARSHLTTRLRSPALCWRTLNS